MPSPFHNMTDSALADEYGAIKQQIAALEEREKALNDELKARLDDVPAIGSRWTVTKSVSTSSRIDTKKLRAAIGDEAAKFETTSTSVRLTVKPTMIFGQEVA